MLADRGLLRDRLAVASAIDVTWTLCSLAVSDLFVVERGWSATATMPGSPTLSGTSYSATRPEARVNRNWAEAVWRTAASWTGSVVGPRAAALRSIRTFPQAGGCPRDDNNDVTAGLGVAPKY
jgi:hypothetical protein